MDSIHTDKARFGRASAEKLEGATINMVSPKGHDMVPKGLPGNLMYAVETETRTVFRLGRCTKILTLELPKGLPGNLMYAVETETRTVSRLGRCTKILTLELETRVKP